MKQNKYDDPDFFAKYSAMPRSSGGLESAGEWPAFRSLLPDLHRKRLLDIGCGFGWHCRYAREQGASQVVGVDLSENMLERARANTEDSAIEHRCCAIEDLDFRPHKFDVVISSLALHYVRSFDSVCRNVVRWLSAGGAFVFSVEHPVFTAIAAQQWCVGQTGEKLHWPVDLYHEEGARRTNWMSENVIKYHRTIERYVNTVIGAGLHVTSLLEPGPTAKMLSMRPEWKDECRRPMFLLISAVRGNPAK